MYLLDSTFKPSNNVFSMIFRGHQIWNMQIKFSKFNNKLIKNPQDHQEVKIIISH